MMSSDDSDATDASFLTLRMYFEVSTVSKEESDASEYASQKYSSSSAPEDEYLSQNRKRERLEY